MERIGVVDILGKEIAFYNTWEEPLFLAKDVAEWIDYNKDKRGYYDTAAMLRTVDIDEKIKVRTRINNPSGSDVWFLTEDGLYEVLMQSRKDIARDFKKKVKAILKEYRKTGSCISDNKQAELNAIGKVIRKVQDVEVLDLIGALANRQRELIAERDELQEILEINKPKIEFANNVEDMGEVCSIGKLAESMSKHGIMIGRNRLMEWMREMGYLCKQKGIEYNRPKQRMIEQGYMTVSIYKSEDGLGNKTIFNTPLVTGKGIVYFFDKYREYWKSVK